ncbi:MAG TPA: HEAT repeat domain-containing protein [Candidatus Thermoplasmatota archaeon]|nr:HEAT repeat domain-containing protein [Candidatus Thermoplasmatota archaeon]
MPQEPAEPRVFETVDPAPALSERDIKTIEATLLDTTQPMFTRMRAIFALRGLGTEEATHAIGRSLLAVHDSALLRHECAYVLGQLQDPASLPYLERALFEDRDYMVRHESAEAMGNLGTDAVVPSLERARREDENLDVRMSAEVALANLAFLKTDEMEY